MTRRPRPAIGARLSGLVEGVEALGQPATTTLPLDALQPGQFQPRVQFAPGGLETLAASIREQGILQPLLVRPLSGGRFEIVAGERRWRAARLAGLTEVPVLLRGLSDEGARLAAAVENLQRENLNPLEEVRARLQVAAATLGLTPGEVVPRLFALDRRPEDDPGAVERLDTVFGALGRESWRSFVKNRAALLSLPGDLQAAVEGGLDYRKALVIGRVDDPRRRAELLEAAADGATVQALREQVAPSPLTDPDPVRTVARRLTDRRTLAALDPARRRKLERLLGQIEALLDGN
ncbi:ParB/RepB/Spo0J family partition protein [Deinococcus sp. MIMF12]|uniref:ParB/RepB/Spo0J family partition protein n=1 Tax=Deinococcus rhizophilus TaxID=3049544 RepID=A0ABT7JHE8_9DEIO|nr:ParB/RepB/Spo0J family partition protein [Deinococcus rhizophilus]MDL2344489.1 ParB/RepB/Spo0J family partition protein [Deinococcus rhizophilus]